MFCDFLNLARKLFHFSHSTFLDSRYCFRSRDSFASC